MIKMIYVTFALVIIVLLVMGISDLYAMPKPAEKFYIGIGTKEEGSHLTSQEVDLFIKHFRYFGEMQYKALGPAMWAFIHPDLMKK